MQRPLETPFLPIVDPHDPQSLPTTLPRRAPALVALRPDRAGRSCGRAWLRRLAATRPVIGHFCVPDPVLRRLERSDPLGLRLARDAGITDIVTMDTPLYGFMTAAQRERASALHLHRTLRTIEAAPRHGLRPIPLLKALTVDDVSRQLDLAQELGIGDVAVYARELLLEHDGMVLRKFVRGAHRRRLQPWLLGAFSPRSLAWGPAVLASQHHYVLARRRHWLDRHGRRRPVDHPFYSTLARRFVTSNDVHGLASHNFAQARLLARPSNVQLVTGG